MRIFAPKVSKLTFAAGASPSESSFTGSFTGSLIGSLTAQEDIYTTAQAGFTGLQSSISGSFAGSGSAHTQREALVSTLSGSAHTDRVAKVSTLSGSAHTDRVAKVGAISSSLDTRIKVNETFKTEIDSAITVSGANTTLLGNLTVQGTQTSLDTATLNVADLNILVASGAADAAAANGAGLSVDGAGATLVYGNSSDDWTFNKNVQAEAGIKVTNVFEAFTNGNIFGSGTLDIGTVNTGQGANELYAMNQAVQTTDDVQFDSFGVGTAASGTAGEIRATGDITAYYSSDERLKENFAPLAGALDKVKAIGGYEFDWKDGIEDVVSKTGHDIGVKAQELQAQYPELVHERDNGYLAVDYIKLNAVLIEAVKELAAKVDELSK